MFFSVAHDPTQLNRQGPDVGTQYRSVVFYADEAQHREAVAYIDSLTKAKAFRAPIVTQVVSLGAFYPAEADHQDFYARNPRQSYCRAVIGPKLDKLRKVFADRLKAD